MDNNSKNETVHNLPSHDTTVTSCIVNTIIDSFNFKKLGEVNNDSSSDSRKDVEDDSAGFGLNLSVVMRPTYSKISLYTDTKDKVDAGTQAYPKNMMLCYGSI